MNTNNKKIILGLGGLVVFLAASYFVFVFFKQDSSVSTLESKDVSALLKPEIVAFLQSIEKERVFLSDRNIMDSDFVKNMNNYSEVIDVAYPKERANPFAP